MIDYEELRAMAAPFARDEFDPAALIIGYGVDPVALTRLALEVVRTSTVTTNPEPSELDVAAVFVQGFQLGLVARTEAAGRE